MIILCGATSILHLRCLRLPSRGGNRWNLASAVNNQVREESDVLSTSEKPDHHSKRNVLDKSHDSLDLLSSKVASKLEEGNFKGAVRLACAVDIVADHSLETWEALERRHPEAHPGLSIMPPPDPTLFSFTINQSTISKVISSFHNGSVGGLDGLGPQHLKQLTGPSACEGSLLLLRALTSLVSLMFRGDTPVIWPHFFGASLVALCKKDRGVLLITVGCTLRRLAAKCAGLHALSIVPDILAPRQLDFGVSRAVDAAPIYLHNLKEDQVI